MKGLPTYSVYHAILDNYRFSTDQFRKPLQYDCTRMHRARSFLDRFGEEEFDWPVHVFVVVLQIVSRVFRYICIKKYISFYKFQHFQL